MTGDPGDGIPVARPGCFRRRRRCGWSSSHRACACDLDTFRRTA